MSEADKKCTQGKETFQQWVGGFVSPLPHWGDNPVLEAWKTTVLVLQM